MTDKQKDAFAMLVGVTRSWTPSKLFGLLIELGCMVAKHQLDDEQLERFIGGFDAQCMLDRYRNAYLAGTLNGTRSRQTPPASSDKPKKRPFQKASARRKGLPVN